MAYIAAAVVCAGFVALASALGLARRPSEVAAAAWRAIETMRDPALDDAAKERRMRAHAGTLGLLFLTITAGAIAALGVPLAAVWLLAAAGVLRFDAVLAALVSWPMLLAGAAALVVKIGYDRAWRRDVL
jgi:hypothetical protein